MAPCINKNVTNVMPAHWNDISSMDMDLSLFRPVYSPKVSEQYFLVDYRLF